MNCRGVGPKLNTYVLNGYSSRSNKLLKNGCTKHSVPNLSIISYLGAKSLSLLTPMVTVCTCIKDFQTLSGKLQVRGNAWKRCKLSANQFTCFKAEQPVLLPKIIKKSK